MAWFICPYKIDPMESRVRYCAMDDFTALINADGGSWSETEVLGNRAIVKVRTNAATLLTIANTAGFRRIPKDRLDDPLSDLTNAQRTALRGELQDAGYTNAEINSRFPGGDIGNFTLRDVLVFLASRRNKPRFDSVTQTIVLDGPVQNCRSLQDVDTAVTGA